MSKKHLTVLVLVSVLLGIIVLPVTAGLTSLISGQSQGLPTLAPMLKDITPGVVNIAVRGRVALEQDPLFGDPSLGRFFNVPDQPPEREFQAAGSGVIVDAARGYILTNNHVVAKAEHIIVGLRDGRRMEAELVGADPEADIAVIKVEPDNLNAVPLGDSDNVEVGDFVIAIGNPFGLGQTVTSGIVSALGRNGLGIEGYEDFIQTDTSINAGNSGGALVNLRGELVGINTAILGPSGGNIGIGLAIPINMVREIMNQIVAYGEVRRGQLGVAVQDLTPDLAGGLGIDAREGTVIAQVMPGSAAEVAGLLRGDVIVAINGEPVRNASHLRNEIGLVRAGQTVELRVVRAGEARTVPATIGRRQAG